MKSLFLFILVLLLDIIQAGTADKVQIYSVSMGKNIPTLVVLPDHYAQSDLHFNTLLLLHGHGGNYMDWQSHTDLRPYADQFQFIIVCPDGSRNSWYLDSPVDQDSQYETFIIDEFIPWLENEYRINDIAITGLSMGGHGALYLSIRHPKLFSAASSMSGGVALMHATKSWDIAQKLGPYEKFPHRWEQYSIVGIISDLETLAFPVLIDCGTDDFFIGINRELHRILLEKGIKHVYTEFPGAHTWEYWVHALDYHLFYLQHQFKYP